jgi:hypothetical protein
VALAVAVYGSILLPTLFTNLPEVQNGNGRRLVLQADAEGPAAAVAPAPALPPVPPPRGQAAGVNVTQGRPSLCPRGQHAVTSAVGGVMCSPCPLGYCGLLPGAEVMPAAALDAPLQATLATSPLSAVYVHRGINPSLLEYQGRRYIAARACNVSACAVGGGSGPPGLTSQAAQAGDEAHIANHLVLCDFGAAEDALGADPASGCR